jgi:long-chain acyl-CoA synthetase
MFPFKNLGQLIGRDRDLSKIAVIDLGGEGGRPREFSYAAIDAIANGVARALLRDGFKRGDRIVILSANRIEFVAACFGIMRAGLVAVPVNFKFPRKTIDFVIGDAGAKLVFCDGGRRADCPSGLPVVCFGGAGADGFDKFRDPGSFSEVIPAANEPAMFLYTSGSTGIPKGVVLSHQSHLWVVETRLAGLNLSQQRYLIAAPLYHMNALALAQLAIAAHSTIVLLPNFTARAYIEAVGKYRCTWLTAVPPMIAMMLRETELLAKTDLSSVQFVRMGSAPVSQSLMSSLKHALPQAAVTNAYGTTEAGPVVFRPHPKGLPTPDMSVGYPHPKVQVRLVDGGNGGAAQGVLEMKCPAVMVGYHNRPDVTSPIGADGFYRTGDVFRRDADGFHYFVGRTDDMFNSGGENIYPGDVERMLETHADVSQAAVVPIDDDIKGQKPVAFIIPKAGRHPTVEQIKQYALANAPAYQHPRFVGFLDRMPLASTNKIDRAALHQLAEERVNAGNETDRQLPVGDEIFLDHVGHFAADPDAASAALSSAGFAPTPRSVQVNPDGAGGVILTGTGNVTSMFRHGYIEVLYKTADTALGRELDAAILRYAGVHLAAFSVSDAGVARRRLESSGFRVRPLAHFERPVETETGPDIAKFTVTRVEPGQMAEGRIQILTHHTEAAVWQPRWLSHPNGAVGLIDVVIVTANIEDAADRFSRFLGKPATGNAAGKAIRLDRGGVQLVTADAFSRLAPDIAIPSLPFIGLYAVAVQSMRALCQCLQRGGLPFVQRDGFVMARFPSALGVGGWVFAENSGRLPWRMGQD